MKKESEDTGDVAVLDAKVPVSDTDDAASWVEQDMDEEWMDEIPDDPFELNAGLEETYSSDCDGEDDDDETPEDFLHQDKPSTPSISEGDFGDPALRYIFKRLKDRIRQACNVNAKRATRQLALEWIFVPNQSDAVGIDFDSACRALGGRPIVVRARTMHQLWRANIMLAEPLPFLAAVPPVSLISEISALIGPGLPEDIAREAWRWPSIPATALRAKFSDAPMTKYQAALESLSANGYVAIASGRVYFISRNPTIMSKSARNRFAFSSAIYGD